MKCLIFVSILFISTFANAQNKEVQQTIDTFFVGFHAKDSMKMKSVCIDKLILQSVSQGPKETKLMNGLPSEFYKSIASISDKMKFQEKITGYTIQVDGAMAHAWTPYEFYINGKLSHKGVNAFTLFKEDTTWKIIYLIDTRRK